MKNKILTLPEINEMEIEIWHLIKDLSANRILQLMGMSNCYAFSIASKWGAIRQGDDRHWQVFPQKLSELASACMEGLGTVTTTVLWMQKYLKKYWSGACNSCPSIRRMRLFMRDVLGVFDFTPQGKSETVVPPDIKQLDFARLLVVFEVCERVLLSRQTLSEGQEVGSELEHSVIPKHRGALIVEMFNALFGRVTRYNRVDHTGDVIELPQAQDIPSQSVVWQWSHCYAIAHKIWINLAKKYQRVTGKKIAIDPLEPVDWDEVANKTKTWMEEQMYEADIPY